MSSPAERFANSRRRGAARHPRLAEFAASLDFPLDDFQERAAAALEEGRGVLVAAPTGAGKTVVGEFAVHLALATGRKAFYTTPIKALSNQKYADLARRHGADAVGLLTGDSSINSEAPVVVMTTEVLRNMMYAGSSTLAGLGYVVMDEVHYLADRFRGAVWEEVIIHLPQDVLVASLSATVSNAEEFGAWLGTVRGDTEVVVSEHRPVPLWQHMLVGRDLYDLFVERTPRPRHPGQDGPGRPEGRDGRGGRGGSATADDVSPDLLEAIRERGSRRGPGGRAGTGGHGGRGRGIDSRHGRREDAGAPRGRRGKSRRGGAGGSAGSGRHARPSAAQHGSRTLDAPLWTDEQRPARSRGGLPSRAEVIALLERDGLLPAITFIFSRAGCDAAVRQLLTWDVRLVDEAEGARIGRLVESRVAGIAAEDLSVLGYWDFLEGLTRGFAAHHAGMLPTFREIVEELFTAGAIRAVFATETLALGINMPARTVVLEKLVKFNGETHADITPAEYTQLTGRAGRRGIDVEGHAVVLWNPSLDPLAVAGLASTRTYPLRSSFRPTYNMTVNLVDRLGRPEAAQVLQTSFAQFQADASIVGLTRQIAEHDEALAGYAEAMTCHLGDFAQYAAMREEISTLEKGAAKERSANRVRAVARSLEDLSPGDVVALVDGRHTGRAVVVAVASAGRGSRAGGRDVTVVTQDARQRRLVAADLDVPVEPLGSVRLPKGFNVRVAAQRRDLAATMRAQVPESLPPQRRRGSRLDEGSRDVQPRIDELRRALRAHPCHACPDREHHARWAERYHRLRRETEGLRRRAAGRTNSVARTFERICTLLDRLGYLADDGTTVTADGRRLARLYSERDLLTAQCLRHGVWKRLDPAGLAAAVSCLVYEPRREEGGRQPAMPTGDVIAAHDEMVRLWSELEDLESEYSVTPTAFPDAGLAWPMHRWAGGQRLETVLRDTDLAAGDFVRRCKQLVDLLDQIADAAPEPALRTTARRAVDAVLRGVVAADRID